MRISHDICDGLLSETRRDRRGVCQNSVAQSRGCNCNRLLRIVALLMAAFRVHL